MENRVYLGVKGRVAAIDRSSGELLWKTHLKGSGFVNVAFDAGMVLAHTRGELFALEPGSGQILWRNGLAGLGYGYITMTSPSMGTNQQAATLVQQLLSEQENASNATVGS